MLIDGIEEKVQGPSLHIELDEATAQGVYANMTIVNGRETEFLMDFVFIQPDGERGKVRARVLLHPRQAKLLSRRLAESVVAHEAVFGAIPLDEDVAAAE